MKRPTLLPVLLLTYVITVAIGVEAINSAWGNLLPNRDGPQYGSGFGKMRGAMGEFQNVLLLFGIWVYPACVIAATYFIGYFRETEGKKQKWLFLACAVVCVAIFARFCYLGVFSSGVGLG
ncbi:hypothetical protein B1R32_110110 [Abditibacterium utsteinense]|uniref:Uncharacterized protein n=1 Tax=Abditibacterium utsteinense TaxID=1960156 RepID=A0A2S8SS52_9BACT|nr:hypothetical protein [Abditibacterium utsteinense]PQV63644.1 hypothetical protein B1R32_110110 [Abditibacterium utsteinense]